ncbi:hypothetical protein ALON55S_03233 [Alishewanella longhuensis]
MPELTGVHLNLLDTLVLSCSSVTIPFMGLGQVWPGKMRMWRFVLC